MPKKKAPEIIEIPQDRAASARRQARSAVGAVRPARPILPKTQRPPKHKRKPGEGED